MDIAGAPPVGQLVLRLVTLVCRRLLKASISSSQILQGKDPNMGIGYYKTIRKGVKQLAQVKMPLKFGVDGTKGGYSDCISACER